MMRRLHLLITFLIAAFALQAQAPRGYYDGTDGLTGDDLKLALHNIIADDSHVSYTPGLWNAFYQTDKRPGTDYVWDIYSDIPNGTPPYSYTLGQGDQCGSYDSEGDCYNREHLWPQSWTSNDATEQTDLHHIYPTDGFVNQQRGNYPMGEVNNATWTSQNGSKLGSCKTSLGYSGTVFEPIDEFKGDIARALMYVSVRYYTEDDDWSTSGMTNKSVIKDWAMTMLLRWHEEDPVSEKEINRNEAVYSKQNNRNPFVDNPEFAEMIWNPNWSSAYQIAVVANPAFGGEVSLTADVTETASIDFSAQGYSDGQVIANATIDDNVSVSFSKGTNSNAPKYYNSGTAIRCYGGNNFTISTTSGSITQIVLTYGSSDGSNAITANVGSFSTNTWTGDAASVTFNIGGTSGNRRIKAMAVTYSHEIPPTQQATCAYGAMATLTATPNEGYSFVNWTKNNVVVSTDAIYSLAVSESATYQANFEINMYEISVAANPEEGGTVVLEGGSPAKGSQVTSIDFSQLGYQNALVLGGVTINLDDNVNVVFNKGNGTTAPTYYNTGAAIRCYAKNNFVVSTSDGSITSIKLTYGTGDGSNPITVSEGTFATNEWTGDAAAVTFTIGGNNGHRRIHAIEVTYSGGGSSQQGIFAYGTTVTMTATPNEDYYFVNWTKNDEVVSTDAVYSYTVTEDAAFIANFSDVENYIEFADANVKAICVANWDTDGDGELSYDEAAAVTDLGEVFKNKTNITSFDELQYFTGLNTIGDFAFQRCLGLTSIVIPNSVTSIGNSAFSDCTNLTLIIIPDSVTSIGICAFLSCYVLNTIEIPHSVTSIGSGAFGECEALTSIEIPNTVTSIGSEVVAGCGNLTQIVVEEGNTVYDSRDYCNAIIETATNSLIAGCQSTIIPNSVISIGEYAFRYCYGLISIEIPNSVISIGEQAFAYCPDLTTVLIGDSVSTIMWGAFLNCDALTSIEIPNSVTSIWSSVFWNCDALSQIIVNEGNTVYDSRDNCNAIIETETNSLIVGCKSTVIPDSVITIGFDAFNYCSSLTSITIPSSVISIGNYAFYYCSGLTSITVMSDTPPAFDLNNAANGAFEGVDKSIPVFVPCNSLSEYQNAEGWDEFTNYQGIDCPVTQTISLVRGVNWVSFNVEITLDDLKTALVESLPAGTAIRIKSQNASVNYSGNTWRGSLKSLDKMQMYMIYVASACVITLDGVPIDPSANTITIRNGINWIAFPFDTSMQVDDAFSGFVADGDGVKEQVLSTTYKNNRWIGQLKTLEPGNGYIYKSTVSENRTFTYPTRSSDEKE